jgi:hypothetical protein
MITTPPTRVLIAGDNDSERAGRLSGSFWRSEARRPSNQRPGSTLVVRTGSARRRDDGNVCAQRADVKKIRSSLLRYRRDIRRERSFLA